MEESAARQPKSKLVTPFTIAVAVLIVALGAFILLQLNNKPAVLGLDVLPSDGTPIVTNADSNINSPQYESDIIRPEDFVSREQYFKEVFKPRRETYKLLEKAAAYLNKPVEQMPVYFGIISEEDIFATLPKPADDFSEVAYLFSSGKYYSIGYLDESYYKQPELYPNFKTTGTRYWTRPDPKYWTTGGYGSYPAEQWDVLTVGEREEFDAVVFFYTSWGVQTYQGVTLQPSAETEKYFDITITPQTFLLEPTFPKFGNGWAHRIEVHGEMKKGTPPGSYKIGINVETPPKEFIEKWEFEHRNLYFNAASAIGPSGNQIQLNIDVVEKPEAS